MSVNEWDTFSELQTVHPHHEAIYLASYTLLHFGNRLVLRYKNIFVFRKYMNFSFKSCVHALQMDIHWIKKFYTIALPRSSRQTQTRDILPREKAQISFNFVVSCYISCDVRCKWNDAKSLQKSLVQICQLMHSWYTKIWLQCNVCDYGLHFKKFSTTCRY